MNEHEYIVSVLRTNTGSTLLRRISYLLLFVSIRYRFFFPFFPVYVLQSVRYRFFFVSTLQSVRYRFSLFLYCSFFVHCMIYCFTAVFFLHCMIYCFTAVFFVHCMVYCFTAVFRFYSVLQKIVTVFSVCIIYVTGYSNLWFCSVLQEKKIVSVFFFSFLYNLSY